MAESNNLPALLRQNGLFCCWKYETRPDSDKPTKVPYNPNTGGRAQSTNPDTFACLDAAEAVQTRYDGLGVGVFGDLGAIDIDHCIDANGEISSMAMEIMGAMSTYTEKSPSGQGLRILFTVPNGFQYDKARHYINNQKAGLEIYIAGATNKFVTVTGDTLTPGLDLQERGEQLQQVLEKYMVRPNKAAPVSGPAAPADLDDVALICRIKRSKHGVEFSALMSGDTSAYDGDDSRADLALCNMLAFWTDRDAAGMDRIFRTSGLMRPKWDMPTAGSTYGAITIQNAIQSYKQSYDPQAHFKQKAESFTTVSTDGGTMLADLHPEKNERYGWHDIGNGYLFADWYKGQARYVPERKKWFVYNGKAWKADSENLRVMEMCKKMADVLAVYALSIEDERQRNDYLDFVKRWQRRAYRETILKDAASVYPVEMTTFDADPFLFNCLNGTLNLKTREFRPHSATDMLSKISGVCYDPEARCNR